MNWIEVMGLSGVGKTTFLKKLGGDEGARCEGVTLQEGVRLLAMERLRKHDLSSTFARAYFKQGLVNSFKQPIAESYFDRKRAFLENGRRYEQFLNGYTGYYYKHPDLDIVEKVYRISLFKKIISDLCLFDLYKFKKVVIFDEGPLNHYPSAIFSDLKNMIESLPKAVIYCQLDENTNFTRIKTREKRRGKPSPLHRNLSDEEIRIDIRKRQKAINEKMTILNSSKVPLLVIDLGQNEKKNIIIAKEFINNLTK